MALFFCMAAEKIRVLNYFICSNIVVHFYCVQTDRAAMLDEIVDYVKFLRLQVKVKMPLLSSAILLLFSKFGLYLYR